MKRSNHIPTVTSTAMEMIAGRLQRTRGQKQGSGTILLHATTPQKIGAYGPLMRQMKTSRSAGRPR